MEMRYILYALTAACCLHLSAQPTIQWQRSYGGSDVDRGTKIIALDNGGYIIVGTTTSTNGDATGCMSSISRVWVLHLDAQGDLLWQRCYGGSGNQIFPYVTATSDGGFAIACRTNSTDGDITTPLGSTDIWVFKIDLQGDLIWERSIGGAAGDDCRGIVSGEDGSLYVFGLTSSSELPGFHAPGIDNYLAKLSPNGVLLNQRCYGGTAVDAAYSMSITPDQQVILMGITSSTDGDVLVGGDSQRWIVAVGPDLEILWQRTLISAPTGNQAHAVKTLSGDLLAVGATTSTEGEIIHLWGEQDMFAVRLNEDLELLHSTAFGGSDDESIWHLLSTPSGGLLAIGNTSSQDGQITDPKGMQDAWLVSLDDTLGLRWMRNFGGSQDDGFFGGAFTVDGGVILTGYSSSLDGDVTNNQGNWDLWVVKLGPDAVGVPEDTASPSLSIFPNPANDHVTIAWKHAAERLRVIDALGRVVHQGNELTGMQQLQLPITDWASGVYTVQVEQGAERSSQRFIKQ